MIIEHEGEELNLPDFLLIGAARSGTTTLFRHFQTHPDLFIPPHKKEPAYFSFGTEKPYLKDKQLVASLVTELSEYRTLYTPAQKNQLLGDCSTPYLYTAESTIRNVKALYGDRHKELKIIAILRNPTERAYSHYSHLIRHGHEKLSFEEAISKRNLMERKAYRWGFDYLEHGNYASQLSHFTEEFKHVKVVLFDDLKEPQKLMDGIFDFLEVDCIAIDQHVKANPSGKVRNENLNNALSGNPFLKRFARSLNKKNKAKLLNIRDRFLQKSLDKGALRSNSRNFLNNYYKGELLQLEKLIGRDLSPWLVDHGS